MPSPLRSRLPLRVDDAPGRPRGSVGPPPPPDYVNVNLDITGHCSNKSLNSLPAGWFFLYDVTAAAAGQFSYIYAYVDKGVLQYAFGSKITAANGKYSLQMVNGHQYIIEAWNSKVWYQSSPFTVSRTNFTLPPGDFTGNIVYDSPSNSLTLKAVFSVNCN